MFTVMMSSRNGQCTQGQPHEGNRVQYRYMHPMEMYPLTAPQVKIVKMGQHRMMPLAHKGVMQGPHRRRAFAVCSDDDVHWYN